MEIGNSYISAKGYRVLLIDGVLKRNSHYVWYQNTGHWPIYANDEVIHHINLIRLDDRFENLQLMTISEHMCLHRTGSPHTEETRAKISAGNIGKIRTEETRAKMSLAKTGENNPMFGKSCPEHSEYMKLWHETHDQSSENNPMYGKTGSSSHFWIEGPVCYKTQRARIDRAKKRIAEGRGTYEDYLLVQDNEEI